MYAYREPSAVGACDDRAPPPPDVGVLYFKCPLAHNEVVDHGRSCAPVEGRLLPDFYRTARKKPFSRNSLPGSRIGRDQPHGSICERFLSGVCTVAGAPSPRNRVANPPVQVVTLN